MNWLNVDGPGDSIRDTALTQCCYVGLWVYQFLPVMRNILLHYIPAIKTKILRNLSALREGLTKVGNFENFSQFVRCNSIFTVYPGMSVCLHFWKYLFHFNIVESCHWHHDNDIIIYIMRFCHRIPTSANQKLFTSRRQLSLTIQLLSGWTLYSQTPPPEFMTGGILLGHWLIGHSWIKSIYLLDSYLEKIEFR